MSCNKPLYAPWPLGCPYLQDTPNCNETDCEHHLYDDKSLLLDLQPTVSILMPYYKAELTVGKAIISLIYQDYPNWELIIVKDGDDGRNKRFQEILNEAVPSDKTYNIKVINQKHLGQAIARNRAFIESTGKYIAYLDADDEYENNHLTECLLFMINNNADFMYADFCYKNFIYSAESTICAEIVIKPYKYSDNIIGRESYLLKYQNFIALNSVMHSRRAFVIGGGFEEGVVCGEDGVLWRRMSQAGIAMQHSDKITSYYCKYNINGMHQSKQLIMPKDGKGIHLVGKGTNGQELDNQEIYNTRRKELIKYISPGEINYDITE